MIKNVNKVRRMTTILAMNNELNGEDKFVDR